MNEKTTEQECCPRFDPVPWNDKVFNWQDKQFIKDRVLTFFYMPLNFGSVIRKVFKKTEEAGALIQDNLCLSDHTSRWNMDIYVATDREVAGLKNVKKSGRFFSRVYEGDFKKTEEWCTDYESQAEKRNLKLGKYFMWYTTCPKCAKKYGKNYVAIIGETS